MLHALTWYLLLLLVTATALPLGWTWFRYLPDRGWGLLRALGLLLMGSTVWFVGSFGVWRLSPGSALGALALLLALGLWSLQRWSSLAELRAWLVAERRLILAQELFFLLAFAFWVWFRIHDVEGIQYTERPMDFALLNGILRGGELPPNDPWLSGFSISYYYLGYLIVAQLAALGSVPSGIAYNLGVATLAALTMGGALSLGYNLLRGLDLRRRDALLAGTLAPLLLALSSNLTGILTLAYHNRLLPDSVFRFFNVYALVPGAAGAKAQSVSGWWWWEASRTVSDYRPDGTSFPLIDEFPFFSFMLGDMHPHVLALPFALLVVGIALNSVRGGLLSRPLLAGRLLLPAESWRRPSAGWLFFLLSALVAGAFAMLNTWDLPTVLTLIAGGWLLALWMAPVPTAVSGSGDTGDLALAVEEVAPTNVEETEEEASSLPIGVASPELLLVAEEEGLLQVMEAPPPSPEVGEVHSRELGGGRGSSPPPPTLDTAHSAEEHIPALPEDEENGPEPSAFGIGWLLSAGALLGSALLLYFPFYIGFSSQADGIRLSVNHTYLPQYLLMFGLFWLVLLPLALTQLAHVRAWLGAAGTEGWLLGLALLLPAIAGLVLQRWTMALIAALLALLLLALAARLRDPEGDPSGVLRVALALAALGLGLTLVPEVIYLQDHFGSRMNTVFKLYYQAWALLSIASTLGVVYLFQRLPTAVGLPWFLLFSLLTALTLWYPLTTMTTKVDAGGPAQWDGRFWMAQNDADRFAAVEWLNRIPGEVVIVERAGGAYQSIESALSGFTGHSTLLGWQGHESQWRGGNQLFAERPAVIDEIYQTADPTRLRELLTAWNVDYVAVTPLERDHYGLGDAPPAALNQVLTPVFEQGTVTIYGW